MDVSRETRAVWSVRRTVTINSFTVGMEQYRGNFNGLSIECDIVNQFKLQFGFFFYFFLSVIVLLNRISPFSQQSKMTCIFRKQSLLLPFKLSFEVTYFCHCSGSRSAYNVEDRYGIPRLSSFIFRVTGCSLRKRRFGQSTFLLYSNSTVFGCFVEKQFLFDYLKRVSLRNKKRPDIVSLTINPSRLFVEILSNLGLKSQY